MFNDLLIYCLNLLYIYGKKLCKVQVYFFKSKSSFITGASRRLEPVFKCKNIFEGSECTKQTNHGGRRKLNVQKSKSSVNWNSQMKATKWKKLIRKFNNNTFSCKMRQKNLTAFLKIVNYDKIKFTFLVLDIVKNFMPIFMRQSMGALGRRDFYFRPYWQKRPLLAGKILILWKPKRNSIIENEYTGRYHFLFSH